jgi:hypothetical protein
MPLISGKCFREYYKESKGTLIPKKDLLERWIEMAKIVKYVHD